MSQADTQFVYVDDPDHPGWKRWELRDPTRFNAFLGPILTRIEGDAARAAALAESQLRHRAVHRELQRAIAHRGQAGDGIGGTAIQHLARPGGPAALARGAAVVGVVPRLLSAWGAPVVVGRDRVAAGRHLLAVRGANAGDKDQIVWLDGTGWAAEGFAIGRSQLVGLIGQGLAVCFDNSKDIIRTDLAGG